MTSRRLDVADAALEADDRAGEATHGTGVDVDRSLNTDEDGPEGAEADDPDEGVQSADGEWRHDATSDEEGRAIGGIP